MAKADRGLIAAGQAVCALLLCACGRFSLPDIEVPRPEALSAAALRMHVMALAADAMEGRGAGYPGERQAAVYIENRLREAGLETTQQHFRFEPRAPERPGDTLVSRNVLAFLPGSDPALAGELVLLGAHHDGQGRSGQADGGRLPALEKAAEADAIWNSADDNASSVAALLEIARALAARPARPRRGIVFATFGAEEHALNGSAFLAYDPWPAQGRVVAMLNVEKIGRVPDHPFIMAGCSSSPAWNDLLRAAAQRTTQHVECLLPELIPDTDHYPFAAAGIPAAVLGTAHEEDTHRPTDEPWRLDFEALARRARYVLEVIDLLADAEAAPRFAPEARRGTGLLAVVASADERAALGLQDHGALKVSDLLPGLPARRAGLQVGDFITALDGRPLDPRVDERAIHERFAEKGRATMAVRRRGASLTITISEEDRNGPE